VAPTRTYGWKLATVRLPTDTYTFDVKQASFDGPDDSVELLLKVHDGDYWGHHLRAFVPKDEWNYAKMFRAKLADEYGIIVPDTIQKLA
jgi:hypothetical protein